MTTENEKKSRAQELRDLISAIPPGNRAKGDPGISLAEQTKQMIDSLTPKEREILNTRFGGADKVEAICQPLTEEERIRELEELDAQDARDEEIARAKVAAQRERRRELTALAEVSAQSAQHAQWIATSSEMDAAVWLAVEEATAALPPDATSQQIALAQARAIRTAKESIREHVLEALPGLRKEADDAAEELLQFEKHVNPWGKSPVMNTVLSAAAAILIPSLFSRRKTFAEKEQKEG